MQSVRLWCRVQRRSQLGELLESYISQSDVLPPGSYQIHKPNSVPHDVRQILTQAVKQGQTWSCWAHGGHIWLFTCHMSDRLSRESAAPVLEVKVYGNHGQLRACGAWMPDQHGKWCRNAV